MTRRWISALRAALGLGLLAWVLSRPGTWSSLGQLFTTTWLLPALALFTALGSAIESVRLGLLLRPQGLHLSFWNGCRISALGAFFNFSIPGGTGGDVMKLYYLAADTPGRRVEVAMQLLVDRLVALFSLLCVLALLAVLELRFVLGTPLVRTLVLAGLALLCALAAAAALAFSRRVRRLWASGGPLERMPLVRYLRRGLDALHRFRHHRGTLVAAVLVSLVGHALLLTVLASAGAVLFPGAPATRVSLLALLGLFANAVPITPGGLGVGEAAFDRLFLVAGYARGSPLILAWRAAQVPICALGGLLYAAGVRRNGPLARASAADVRGELP